MHVALDQLDTDGRIVVQGGSSPETYYTGAVRLTYSGGEQVIDPFTHLPMTYLGGEAVRDLFTQALVYDPFGNVVLHHAGDRVLHYAGDQVVHSQGDVQTYLGGEPVFDEQGHPVYDPSSTFDFTVPGSRILALPAGFDLQPGDLVTVTIGSSTVAVNGLVYDYAANTVTLPGSVATGATAHLTFQPAFRKLPGQAVIYNRHEIAYAVSTTETNITAATAGPITVAGLVTATRHP